MSHPEICRGQPSASETGFAASDVLDAAGEVSRQPENLSREVHQFMAAVRFA
jgi:hypothetical protein